MRPTVNIARTQGADPMVDLPRYETNGAAGADVRANLELEDRSRGMVLVPGARRLVPTGIRLSIPAGFEIQVRPRSGLALKHGVTLANSPGTIDSDYRGPLGVILINLGAAPFIVNHGDRIAQLVLAAVVQAGFIQSDTLDETARGGGGFGSTGRD